MAKLKVLFATSEAAPLIKTGGLGDVSGALPAALRAIGVDVRVLLPGYRQVIAQLAQYKTLAFFDNLPGFPSARLLSGVMANGVPLFVLDCPGLYARAGGPYQDAKGHDWADNPLRFGLLSKIAAVLGSSASPLGWHPDLVHCNDWQTGLAPAYLRFAQGAAPSVFTIHNMAFQGNFAPETVQELRLPPSCFGIDGVEFYGHLSFLKAGLFYADHITTVSPNYAKEIRQPELGFGMQGLLVKRSGDLTGILNGIDTDEWNPATDIHLVKKFSAARMAGKSANKELLQVRLGLSLAPDVPLLGVVSRFTHQKGLDLLLEIAPRLIGLPVQLAILGGGEAQMQQSALGLSQRHPGKVGVNIGFSEELAHQIEAGADMFIMPSRFEPCGLNQLYSQCYGTLPVVHATGGLVDSVVDCTAETLKDGTASGFVFKGMTAENLFAAIRRAVGFYHDQRKWKALRRNCMAKDFSWKSSAEAYRAVYLKVLGR
ncbi:MAG: starch synthase [Gallionellales bacterium GWA2_55_18]|nr:MAG: starch synthase [Gallionellales bacterium GWA2_55_18]